MWAETGVWTPGEPPTLVVTWRRGDVDEQLASADLKDVFEWHEALAELGYRKVPGTQESQTYFGVAFDVQPDSVTLVLRRIYNDAETDQIVTEDVDFEHDSDTDISPDALIDACEAWVLSFDDPLEPGQYFVEAREPGTYNLLAESECVEVDS
jgi:hypothetical protein